MSLYLIVFIMLLAFAIYEYRQKHTQKTLYWIAFFVLTAMLVFRYGQGTDYFGYYYNFLNTPTIWQLPELLSSGIHGEPGWLFISAIFRGFGIPFQFLVALSSLLTMYCLHRFLSRHSTMMTLSLLLAYPTIYLTYAMSAIRQVLVLAVFLGFLLDWLYEKKYVRYIAVTLVCALFHSSALVFLMLFGVRLITLDTKKALIAMAVSIVAGFVSNKLLAMISSAIATYADAGISIVAVGERALSTAAILYVFHDVLENKESPKDRKLLYLLQVYLYGGILYCLLLWSSLLASRFGMYFKAVEIVLFAIAASDRSRRGKVVAAYLLVLVMIMYFKNIPNYISQGKYYASVNTWNFPYISVFWKEAIATFREIPYNFSQFLN